jgi:hypothetical protein
VEIKIIIDEYYSLPDKYDETYYLIHLTRTSDKKEMYVYSGLSNIMLYMLRKAGLNYENIHWVRIPMKIKEFKDTIKELEESNELKYSDEVNLKEFINDKIKENS